MNYEVHKHFIRTYSKLHKGIKDKVNERLILFLQNPFAEILNNHPLKGKYQDCRSINVTGDYRAIYRQLAEDRVLFVKLGTHSELYD